MKLDTEQRILEAADMAITNTREDANAQQWMNKTGFTEQQLQEGSQLLQQARDCKAAQIQSYHDHFALCQRINQSKEEIGKRFREHLKVARIAFRQDASVLRALGADRPVKSHWQVIQQAEQFYYQLSQLSLSLEAYGISPETLRETEAAIAQLLLLKKERARKKAQAESSTQKKKKALQALRAWVMHTRNIARVAFKEDPQLLEMYGISVVSP